jgi:hypothetical protein
MEMEALQEAAENEEVLRKAMLDAISPGGIAIGNKALREKLGWAEALYWSIRNKLVEEGLLVVARGKGGSVRKHFSEVDEHTSDGSTTIANGKAGAATPLVRELDLYDPMREAIADGWSMDNRWEPGDFVVDVTGKQGSAATGKWARPDITFLGVRRYAFVPAKYFEVITFEVKPSDDFNVTCVYEALGHRRSATRSYALIHIPAFDDDFESKNPAPIYTKTLQDIVEEAKKHGIGVIVAQDPGNYDTWFELAEAIRAEPDPEKLNEFLGRLPSKDWLRKKF